MADPLPQFPYHPTPEESGVIEPSDASCEVCAQARGYAYTGPIHGADGDGEPALVVCPWCIADGQAHATLGVSFVAPGGVGGFGEWGKASEEAVDRVSRETPCFRGWQPERWFTCCGDAAVFLGPAGWREIQAAGSEAVRAIKQESGFEGEDWEGYYPEIERNGEVRAYLFKCSQCGTLGGYSDCE